MNRGEFRIRDISPPQNIHPVPGLRPVAQTEPQQPDKVRWQDRLRQSAVGARRTLGRWGYNHPYRFSAVLVVLIVGVVFFVYHPVKAGTALLVPNADVSTGFSVLGGSSDASCNATSTVHCNYVDEGANPSTTDYSSTGTGGTTGETEEYGLTSVSNLASASKVVVNVFAESATNANGTILDDISINLRVNGTLQSATTCTPAFNFWSYCTATYTGSWTQSDVDGMQIQIVRTTQGTGGASSNDDDVRIAGAYAILTYVPNVTYNQASYRVFSNQDASSAGSFVKAYGGSGVDNAVVGAVKNDGGYVTASKTSSFGLTTTDVMLSDYDSTGVMSWSKTWGGGNGDSPLKIVSASDGGYAVTGFTSSFGAGGEDAYIIKYDANGTIVWQSTFGNTGNDRGQDIVQTSDGGYAITGYANSTGGFGAGGIDAFLAKFDSGGSLSWFKLWGDTGTDVAYGLVQTYTSGVADGYAIVGNTNSYGDTTSGDLFIADFDLSGNLNWSRTWGGSGAETSNALVQTTSGDLVALGYTPSFTTSTASFLVQYSSSGTLNWARTWGGSSAVDAGWDLTAISGGGVVAAGQTATYGVGGNDGYIFSVSSSGSLNWSRTWGGSGNEQLTDVKVTPDGGYVVFGTTLSIGAGSNDIVILKTDGSGNIANCSAACTSPSVTLGTPSGSTSSPSATNGGATPTTGTPSNPNILTVWPTTTVSVAVSPTIDVGSTALAALNTAAPVGGDSWPFRVRVDVGVSTSALSPATQGFKLQYAARNGTCDTAFSGETYNDVTDSSTVAYYDNSAAMNNLPLTTNANDPTDSGRTLVRQTYNEKGTTAFTSNTSIPSGQDGMWDFALTTNGAPANTHYCLRIVSSDGTVFSTYSQIPELVTPTSPTLSVPASGATGLATVTPSFQLSDTQSQGHSLQYKLKVCTNQALTTGCQNIDQTTSSSGWTAASYASGATGTYNGISSLSWGTTYWWSAQAYDATDLTNFSAWAAAQSFTTDYSPQAPTLAAPSGGQTGLSTTPELRMYTNDQDNDYMKYEIILYDSNCSSQTQTGTGTYDQNSSQIGWSSQNTQSGSAYTSGQTAVYKLQTTLAANTQYCWKAAAKDPAGSNTFGSFSGTQLFTTAAATKPVVNIGGGTTVYSGTTIGN